MALHSPIRLDHGWACEWFELEPDLYEFLRPEQVADLAAWTFDQRRVGHWAAWLYRTFEAPALSKPRYYLLIDSAPSPARLYINDQHIGDYQAPGDDDPPFELEITAQVRPALNRIAIRVDGESVGCFSGVSILPVDGDR